MTKKQKRLFIQILIGAVCFGAGYLVPEAGPWGGVRHSIEEIPETEGYTGGCGNGAAYLCGGRR